MRKKANMDTDHLIGYRVMLYPTDNQRKEINKNIHGARAVYNLGLELQNKAKEKGEFIKFYPLITEFARMRNEDPDKSWLKGLSVGTIREALHNLDNAFHRYFSKQNRHPKFKSRKTVKKSFTVRSDRTSIQGEYIRISGLDDYLILAKDHHIPSGVRLHNTTVSFDGINYWFSCTVESDTFDIDMSDVPQTEAVGIDVGIVNMITTSDGQFYKFTDVSKYEKRLKRQQRRISRDCNGYYNQSLDTRTKYEDVPKSKNHSKRLKQRLKTIRKISNIRQNDTHTATKEIVSRNPAAIVIENISVREQMGDKWIRKYAPMMMYYEIHRQLKYKAARRGIPVIIADKGYPSSKICSRCGSMGNLNHRQFRCPICGYKEDRDLNAAYNLRDLAYQ